MKKSFLPVVVALMSVSLGALSGCGGSVTDVSYEEWESTEGVIVPAIPELNKSRNKDFIFGMDVSSIIEVEEAGGQFYDFDGNPVRDIMTFLADCGVNYIRIRLWNDPFDEYGNSFGGGGNDITTDIAIAQRAVNAGMKVCLDFHYSDFWADPSKQTTPRAWADYDIYEIRSALYDYTYDTLKAFDEAGCLPDMVQIGNEINSGILTDKTNSQSYCWCLNEGISATRKYAKETKSDIKIVLHYAEAASYNSVSQLLTTVMNYGVTDFDIIGLSYYSYWHGGIDELKESLAQFEKNFKKYDIAIMEYSYGYTDDYTGNAANIYNSDDCESMGGYVTSVQGQASYIHDVNEAVAQINNGIGTFYWEPAWLPLDGTSWASSYASDYLTSQGDDTGSLDKVTWANQALFDFDGHPLDSLKAYRLMKGDAGYTETTFSYDEEMEASVNIAASDLTAALPQNLKVLTELDRWVNAPITWDKDGVQSIRDGGEGVYSIHGTASYLTGSFDVTGNLTCYYEYLANGGFEECTGTADISDFSLVPGWSCQGTGYRVERKGNAHDGFYNFNLWASSNYSCTITQEVYCDAGDYFFQVYGRSGSGLYPDVTIFVEQNGNEIASATFDWSTGEGDWPDWLLTTTYFSLSSSSSLTVGARIVGDAADWAHLDDFALGHVLA